MEASVAIRSTGTPALARRNGRAVNLKPTEMPSGRISKLNTQGAGGRRASRMMAQAYQLRTRCKTVFNKKDPHSGKSTNHRRGARVDPLIVLRCEWSGGTGLEPGERNNSG